MDTFREGDWVLVTTQKGKDWLIRLKVGGSFSCHLGTITHEEIMNRRPGDIWRAPGGTKLFLFAPSMKDFLFHMARKTQIIYPKDIGAIVCYGDLGPSMSILECGVGSGALTMFLLRVIGLEGRLVSFERRLEFAKLARENIIKVFGSIPQNWSLVVSDIENPPVIGAFDRIVLDLPEPWKAVETSFLLLKNGGILTSLSPQINQLQIMVKALKKRGFRCIEVFEILKREWIIDEDRSRPLDRMVGHTGFLLTARKTGDRQEDISSP